MAIIRRTRKTLIALTSIAVLLSLALLYKSTHSTLTSKNVPNNQKDNIPRVTDRSNELSLDKITDKQLAPKTLNTNLSKLPSTVQPGRKNPIVPSKRGNLKTPSTCAAVHVVYLRGNWIEAPKWGYQEQECSVPCLYSKDTRKTALDIADAVVVYLPTTTVSPSTILKKYKIDESKVLKVGMSMESTEAHPHQFDYLTEYDIEVTYRMSSHVPNPYFTFARGKQNLLEEIDSTWESREKAVLFVARNCETKSRREQLVKMLQKHVRIDSVSDCLHNKDWPADIPQEDKRALLRRYVALLAAENSIEADYVTEKVYAGLVTGAVPVYYGAPNVEKFVPSNSVIKVPYPLTDEGVKRVAEKIQLVFNSKEEYERLTRFKRLGKYEDKFLETFNFTRVDVKCRLCQKIHSMKCS